MDCWWASSTSIAWSPRNAAVAEPAARQKNRLLVIAGTTATEILAPLLETARDKKPLRQNRETCGLRGHCRYCGDKSLYMKRVPERKRGVLYLISGAWVLGCLAALAIASAGAQDRPMASTECREEVLEPSTPQELQPVPSKPQWQYGGFFDVGYLLDFNHPANDIFRSRGTTWHVDDVHLNMAAAYIKRDATEQSRWGTQLTVQGGKDSQVFGFSATAPKLSGYRGLRHLGLANVSYLAPLGKGLTLQGGIFGSLIGYDALYAKDNFSYTRPWGADFTPYFMMGVNASYPFTEKLTGTFFLINGYWHLANANCVPSFGGQIAYTATSQ